MPCCCAPAVVVDDGLGVHVDGSQAPVHPQVDRDQDEGQREQVHLLGPPLDFVEADVHESGIEKGGEGVHGAELHLAPL